MEVETHTAPAKPKRWYSILYVQVIIAMVAGISLGYFDSIHAIDMKPLGDGFIKLVKMMISPLIFLTVSLGIAGMSDMKKVGKIAGKAFIYFIAFSTLALIIGLVVSYVVQPGAGMNVDPATIDTKDVDKYIAASHDQSTVTFLMHIIPDTFIGALTGDSIIQVLFIAILFGLGLAYTHEKSQPVTNFLKSLSNPVFKIISMLMKLAPIGAFGAMAFTIGKFGIQVLWDLGKLVGTFYLTSGFFVIVVLGLVARYNKFSIFRLIKYLKEEILLVLGTSSSEPAMPGLIQKMEKAGCAEEVVGLVVPTGYSFNLDGTNIYMTLAALFIAQACNVDLTWTQLVTLLLVAMLSSKGAAGVTGAGFITLAATLSVIPSIPVAGIALIYGVDKFMSECRALTNFIGNAVATVVVARWENKLDDEALKKTIG